MVVRVSLRIQVIKENIHFVWRQELRRGLHVVVPQAGMMRVRVLTVQHGVMVHPARLLRRHIHRYGSALEQDPKSVGV